MSKPVRAKNPDDRSPTFIREWRKHRDHTLESLAEALGELAEYPMTHGQLSRVERGLQPYTQDLLEALAIVLRCEPADLLRRGPEDTSSIQTTGLAPDQVELVKGMVADMRRRAG